MNNKNKDTPVVVMGVYTSGLSIARTLGRRGIKVIGVSLKRLPATYSRFLTCVKEPQIESENERLKFFINLGQKFKSRAVIFPVTDLDVMFLSRNRDVLEEYFLFFLPSHKLLNSLTSKLNFIDIAEKNKIPLPRSIRLKNQSDLEKIPSGFFPCVLKPESPHSWLTSKAFKSGIGGLKAIPARNKSELFIQYNRVKEVESKLTLQKMIVGPDENHFDYHAFIDSDGRIVGEFVGQKFRLTPPHFGMGCYVESVKSDMVVNEGRRILSLLNYKGVANINFKKDERDGQLYFFELNPRMSVWIGLDIACGIDIPYYYYKTCLGERIVPKEEYLIGKTWLRLYEDIRGIRPLLKDGSLTWHQWILSVVTADSGAIYALDDPLPAAILFFHTFKGLTKRFILKFRRL